MPNVLNQYDSVGAVNFAYDGNGNLTSDGNNTYVYDEQNRLSSAISGSSSSYAYDAFNRRVSKTVDGTTTYFVYDNDEVVAEYDAVGTLLRDYVMGDSIDEVLTMTSYLVSPTTYYYHYDGLGSVTEITDSTGAIVESYEYDAYGNPSIYDSSHVLLASSAIGNPYMFTGRRWDEETGTYFYRARQYDPKIGRFLQRDPVGYYDGMNLYEYVGNNPINWTDPRGLFKTQRDKESARKAACERQRREQELEDFVKKLRTEGVERLPMDPYIKKKIADKWEDLPYNVRNYQNWNPLNWGLHPQGKRFNNYHVSTEFGEDGVYLHYDYYDVGQGPGFWWYHMTEEAFNE